MTKLTSVIAFLAMLFLAPVLVHAQGTVSGTVTANGKPIENVSVVITKGGGTTTDKDGKYEFSVPAGTYTITFSNIGFAAQSVNFTLTNGQKKVIDIIMLESNQNLQDIMVVGTRSMPRSSVTTALPVDNIDAASLKTTGQQTFDKTLQYRVPSFNTVNTPVNDATTLLDPYEIRNLGPSRTLILVNGKRKNLSSLLYVQFSPGRGETGSDLSAIPVDAIKSVEILRDGASAQYGSDAIAGVMNVILKDRYQYSSLNISGGGTSSGDGGTYGVSFNSGSNFAGKGFINYTVAFNQQDNAIRSGIVDVPTEIATFGGDAQTDQQIKDYLAKYPTANNENGTGATTAAKFVYNLGIPIGENAQFYSNAAYVAKKVFSNANYRTPYWRSDLGLLHPAGTEYIGYEPTFEGDLNDYNATVGIKNVNNGWKQDISITVGGNQQLYAVNNTLNRSLGTASPTSFKPGGFNFSNVIGNIDVSKSVTDNFAIGFGTEVRKETYKIIAGDTASYSGEGANSFPGIRQENASINTRFNMGAYLDASWDLSKAFMVNGTVRGEKYSDFGSAFVWKLSSRLKLSGDNLVLRGSASTGFRAPTLHQIYAQSTQASFVGGTIQLSGLFNNTSKQAFALGIPALKPEKSENYTVGLGVKVSKDFSFTLDYYNITIKDRIVYSSSISSSDPNSQLGQILTAAGVKNIQFFINGIKTNTQGLDFVASYKNINVGKGKMVLNLAGNYNLANKILGSPQDPQAIKDGGSSILNTQIKSLLTESRPVYKFIGGVDYNVSKWNFNLNNTLFGPNYFRDLDNGGSDMENIRQAFIPKVVTDLNIGYNFSSKVAANFTVNNIFNVLPEWKLEALNADGQAVLDDPEAKNLLEGFLCFSGRYRILGYNGSHFSQLGTTFNATLTFKF
ncbi:TonB-dependent receptor [Limnovirga soli]|uniref:TonB-dependent receptor n=1 Tax=Limnovirga soli TaxID=2656915 RepID=A0A8J8FEN6_9BACT|nr:TonB-dependent receptor [Limnovirga soli]NNV56533.1 TonB-dependent receptor [Limnovirga soli]